MRQDEDGGGLAPPQDPATRAFENLRAEVTVLRRSLEELPAALEGQRPPDYTTTLGTIARELGQVNQRLDVIEQRPALKLTPEQHGRAIEQAGVGLVRDAAAKLNQVTRDTLEERRELAGMIGMSREKAEQRKWLIGTAVAGIVAGLVLFPFLGRVLPDSLSSRMAAITVGEDRWNAGIALMRAVDPQGTNDLAYASRLAIDNAEAIGACRQDAYQTGEAQSCTVSVEPGG